MDSLPPVTTPAFLDMIFGVWIQYPVLLLIAGRSGLALSFLTRKRTHKVSEFPSGSPKISAPDSNLPFGKNQDQQQDCTSLFIPLPDLNVLISCHGTERS